MTRAFVFPGQGSQSIGMGKALYAAFPVSRDTFDAVDEALGEALSTLIFEGSEDDLRLTRNAQPALMVTSLAALRAIESESGHSLSELAGYVAGHSLGEYSALAAAGALEIGDAARLLRQRGEAMQAAVPVGEGAMAVFIGTDMDGALEIAREAEAGEICTVANDNAPGQLVVSGARSAVERAIDIAKERGVKRAVLLPVSAPFHCSMMAPAADAMAEALTAVTISPPIVPVVANVTAMPTEDPVQLRQLLVEQVTAQVRWRECVAAMAAAGVTEQVEVGAGKVLSGLARRIDRDLQAVSVGTPEDVAAFVATL